MRLPLNPFSRRTFFSLVQAAPLSGALLVIGQTQAHAFLLDGGLREVYAGLSGILGLAVPRFEPQLGPRNQTEPFALQQGVLRDPAAFTIAPGVPLWQPGNPRTFLVHQADTDALNWQRGAAGAALQRFIRSVMTESDRARCLGILWLQGEAEAPIMQRGDSFMHAFAMRRLLTFVRADFGRPAQGANALPAFFWTPPPYGGVNEGQRWAREALASLLDDEDVNASLVAPQTADVDFRGDLDTSMPEGLDMRRIARRMALGLARGFGNPIRYPAFGPRITEVLSTNPFTTEVIIAMDRGTTIKVNGKAHDGRGWSVTTLGETRAVHSVHRAGPTRLLLRHQIAGPRRTIAYCLFGERLGRGNAITDDWGSMGEMPDGMAPDWRFDMPLQPTLRPLYAG
jgi:hypothetical protein